jgi:hypothetical protein
MSVLDTGAEAGIRSALLASFTGLIQILFIRK